MDYPYHTKKKTMGFLDQHLWVIAGSNLPFQNFKLIHPNNAKPAEYEDYRNLEDWSPLFNVVKEYYDNMKIPITEVIYHLSQYVVVVLEHRNADTSKLLHKAGRVPCFYMYDNEMGRPERLRAQRQIVPIPGKPDETEYQSLQPGVRISSEILPGTQGRFRSSSAGL